MAGKLASARLAKLEKARAKLTPGTVLNANEMAKVISLTWRRLRTIIERDGAFPVASRGGNGVAWAFEAVTVVDHLIGREKAALALAAEREAHVSHLAGVGDPAPRGPSAVSSIDLAAHSRGLKALGEAQMIAHRLKVQQGMFVPAADLAGLLQDMMTTVQTETLSIASRLDPSGQWPPHIRAGIEEELREMLVKVHDRLNAWLAEQRAAVAA